MTDGESASRKRHVAVRFLPFDVTVEVKAGTTILDAAIEAGLPLKTSCGGKGTCGDCVVKVINGEYETAPSAALSAELARENYVLACLTKVTGDLTADLPHMSGKFSTIQQMEQPLSGNNMCHFSDIRVQHLKSDFNHLKRFEHNCNKSEIRNPKFETNSNTQNTNSKQVTTLNTNICLVLKI